MLKRGARVSVLGDSISTYEGFAPYGYAVYYSGERVYDNELTDVNDTWWMQVITAVGGELCANNSYSGSTVTGAYFPAACSERRCGALGTDTAPDAILIYMGTNDRGMGLSLGTDHPDDPLGFYGAYRLMLRRLKDNYPAADIFCATLPLPFYRYDKSIEYGQFARESIRYNEAIIRAAGEEGCTVADLALFGERYETLDGCHPTAAGHRTLAELWLRALGEGAKE